MRQVDFRSAREADRTAIIRLWEACDLVRPWNDPGSDVDRKLAVDDGLFIVGVVDRDVLATVMAGYDGHRGWINYLAVDPAEQRTGIGEQLMAEAEGRLAALGCAKVNLQIRRENDGVGAFYERLGYVGDDVISMGKRLVADDR